MRNRGFLIKGTKNIVRKNEEFEKPRVRNIEVQTVLCGKVTVRYFVIFNNTSTFQNGGKGARVTETYETTENWN